MQIEKAKIIVIDVLRRHRKILEKNIVKMEMMENDLVKDKDILLSHYNRELQGINIFLEQFFNQN